MPFVKVNPLVRTQQQRAAEALRRENHAKATSKRRDDYHCRWPGCQVHGRGVQSAHVEDKRMGGDPQGIRSWFSRCFVTLCAEHHRRITEQLWRMDVGPNGGDGYVEFIPRPPEGWKDRQ